MPPISTASLPDVIFMILFFFMVSTTMRDQELLVRYKLPEATEVQKLEKKSLVSFIHIGHNLHLCQVCGNSKQGRCFKSGSNCLSFFYITTDNYAINGRSDSSI